MSYVVWSCNVSNLCSQRGAQGAFGFLAFLHLSCKLSVGEPAASFRMSNILPDLKYSQHASANGNSSWPLQQSVVLHERKGSITELYSTVSGLQTPSWC